MTAEDLARCGKEGRGAILTALRELKAVGYVATRRRQMKRGRWITETFVFEVPRDAGMNQTEVGFPDVGLPNVGLSVAKSSKKPKRKEKQQQTPSTRNPSIKTIPLRSNAAAREPLIIHGVTCWTDADRQSVCELVRVHGASSVQSAAEPPRLSRRLQPLRRLEHEHREAVLT